MILRKPAATTPVQSALTLPAVQKLFETANNQSRSAGEIIGPRSFDGNVRVLVKNTSSAAMPRGKPVYLGAPAIDPATEALLAPDIANIPFIATVPTVAPMYGQIAILEEPLAAPYTDTASRFIEPIGQAMLRGAMLVQLKVYTGLEWCMRADYEQGIHTLSICPQGAARVLWKDEGPGDDIWALIHLGDPEQIEYLATATSTIEAGGNGSCELRWAGADTGSEVQCELDWMHGDQDISDGKQIVVKWFPDDQFWRVMQAECED
jgi:hypothetical protein